MKLAAYLRLRNLTTEAFGLLIGVKQQSVSRYANGSRVPHRAVMQKIKAATEGAVTADDFTDGPEVRAIRRRRRRSVAEAGFAEQRP